MAGPPPSLEPSVEESILFPESQQTSLVLPQSPESPQRYGNGSSPAMSSRVDALQTLTSGQKRDIRGGAIQAHICVVASQMDVAEVLAAFKEADGFRGVASWSYAYRIAAPATPDGIWEAIEDDLDQGVGEKILGVLRRAGLNGLLLVVSRWQNYGASSALDEMGTSLYSLISERCKDLIANLKKAVGMADGVPLVKSIVAEPNPEPSASQNFSFGYLPKLTEPRVPKKYSPNHFMADSHLNRPQSLPNLFEGGDVRLWMENDKCLRQLTESELWALRSMRLPDVRIESILQAVSSLRGQRSSQQPGSAAARWGQCREVLRSATFRTELLLFDAKTVNAANARLALQLVDGLVSDDVRRVNAGAAALLEWVHGVANWCLNGPPVVSESATGLQALRSRQAELPGVSSPPGHCQVSQKTRPRLGSNKNVSPLLRDDVRMVVS